MSSIDKIIGETTVRCRNCTSTEIEIDDDFYACNTCGAIWTVQDGQYMLLRQGSILGQDDAVDWNRWQRSGIKDPDPVSLETKRQYTVFEHDPFIIIKMPADEEFIRREGFDMAHCLLFCYKEYCERLKSGAQVQFSLVDTRDGLPKVNFELSLEQSSYGGPVTKPVITQIRGKRNQCPPADEYLPALMAFFQAHPEWQVGGHGVRNFDGGQDGDKVIARWNQIKSREV